LITLISSFSPQISLAPEPGSPSVIVGQHDPALARTADPTTRSGLAALEPLGGGAIRHLPSLSGSSVQNLSEERSPASGNPLVKIAALAPLPAPETAHRPRTIRDSKSIVYSK
jgi:hypothetical protein